MLYYKPNKVGSLDILHPTDAVILERLEDGRKSWGFFEPDPTSGGQKRARPGELTTERKDADALEAALNSLARKASQELTDKGIRLLYITFGRLNWQDPREEEGAKSPIILIPINLQRPTPRDAYAMSATDEDPVLNPVLSVKLRNDFGIELPSFDEHTTDAGKINLDSLLKAVQKAVAKQKGWTVTHEVTVGLFSFHKEVMYRDLVENAEHILEHDAIKALVLGPEVATDYDFEPIPHDELDDRAPPEGLVSILDADATQRTAIVAAKEGNSFVVDGPPGTGKSQTIANIIAELARDKKSILFVSEKAAALDVVYQRLHERGLGDYILKLHNQNVTRKEVAQELARCLTDRPRAPGGLSESELAKLANKRQALTDYARAMNELRRPLGRSLHTVLGRIAQLQHGPHAPPSPKVSTDLTPADLESTLDAASRLAESWDPVDRAESFFWRDAASDAFSATTRQKLQTALKRASTTALELDHTSRAVASELRVPWPVENAEQTKRLLTLLDHARSRPAHCPSSWASTEPAQLRRRLDERAPALRQCAEAERVLEGTLGHDWHAFPASIDRALAVTLAHLSQSDIPWDVHETVTEEKLRVAESLLQGLPADLKEVAAQAQALAPNFGFSSASLSLEDARKIAELGMLAGEPSLPEARWFEPHALPVIKQAVDNLEKTVKDFQALEAELRSIYKPSILDQDLDGLCARFETVHKSIFRIFRAAYRTDKKVIAACAREGRLTPRARANLRRAQQWQATGAQLIALESKSAHVTNGHYYKGTETDFDQLQRAVEIARKAVHLVGEHLDRERLRESLSVEARRDPATPLRAKQLLHRVALLESALEAAFGESATVVERVGMPRAAAWCDRILGDVRILAELFTESRLATGRSLPLSQLKECAKAAAQRADAVGKLAKTRAEDEQLLGPLWMAEETDVEPIRNAIKWFDGLHERFGPGLHGEAAGRFLMLDPNREIDPYAARLVQLLHDWQVGVETTAEAFAPKARPIALRELATTFRSASAYLETLRENIGQIAIWQEYERARHDLSQAGFEAVVTYCESAPAERGHLAAIIERSALEKWADLILRSDARIGEIRAEARDRLVADFQDLDQKLVLGSTARVVNACNERRPRAAFGAAGVIQQEGHKKKKHKPIKTLLTEAGPLIQDLKPCFMMSPLTVSQFLPSTLKFDAVIFDEASQVLPSDAVNCIYRGNQVIVAGDQKQLPPTTFFQVTGDDGGDEYEEGELDVYESVLDQCKSSGLRSISLGWHYRSQHEDLIAFSNHRFYNGRLITFPSSAQKGPDLGVTYQHVEGIYDRGGRRDNQIEAKAVVQRVFYHARAHPHLSLGVVALSEPQMSAIEAELQRERKKPENSDVDSYFAEDRLRGFFVKNLENVQGDERDIIIMSIGYAKDNAGKLTMNFGPINRPAIGWRRLNVAVTRAKRRLEVIASISHKDFAAELSNPSVAYFRDYLRFAEEGGAFLLGEYVTEEGGFDSPFEEEVAGVLAAWGYDVASQVGTAGYRVDLAIRDPKNPERYVLGIECDGAMYHSGRVARDRDRLREAVLTNLGWRLHRIWGAAWYQDRTKAEERLRHAITEALTSTASAIARGFVPHPAPRALLAEREVVELSETLDWTTPYRETKLSSEYFPQIDEVGAQSILRRQIGQIVKREGPVARGLVVRRICSTWGIRAAARANDAIDYAIQSLVRERAITEDRKQFLRVPGSQLTHVRTPSDEGSARKTEEVPPEELELAIRLFLRDAKKMEREELTRRVALVFGWRRRGPDIQGALENALDALIQKGEIVERGDHLEAPK